MRGLRQYRYLDLITAIFITVLVVSNIASSAKIIDWGTSLFGIRLAFDAGTLLFPISYIFGDILTEVYGYRASRRVIWTGFVCLALAAGIFAIVAALPGEAAWQEYAGEAAYRAILGGMASGGIILASLVAYWCGEFANSFILARLKVLTEGRWLWVRTISSTLVGELVDSVLFVVIASLFGVFPWQLFVTLMITNYLFKVSVEVIMTPVTYLVVRSLKRVEREDVFDRDTNFNPFQG
jgi:queuosine precursor transporter